MGERKEVIETNANVRMLTKHLLESTPVFDIPDLLRHILTVLLRIEQRLQQTEYRMGQALDDLAQQVEENTSVEESAVQLIQNIADQLASAGNDPAKIQELQESLRNSAQRLAEAVTANTSK